NASLQALCRGRVSAGAAGGDAWCTRHEQKIVVPPGEAAGRESRDEERARGDEPAAAVAAEPPHLWLTEPVCRAETRESALGNHRVVLGRIGSVSGARRLAVAEQPAVREHVHPERCHPRKKAVRRVAIRYLDDEQAAGCKPAEEPLEHPLCAFDVFEDERAVD